MIPQKHCKHWWAIKTKPQKPTRPTPAEPLAWYKETYCTTEMFQRCHKYLFMCICIAPANIRAKFQKKFLTEKKHLARCLTHSKHSINYTYFYPESPIPLLCSSLHANCKFQKYSTHSHHCMHMPPHSLVPTRVWYMSANEGPLVPTESQNNKQALSQRASFSFRWFVQWTTILLKLTSLFKIVIKMGKRYRNSYRKSSSKSYQLR